MSIITRTLLGAAAAFMLAGSAMAQQLILSSWLPPHHPLITGAIEPWAAEVARVTEGRVTVRILRRALGTPQAHYELVREGATDLAYGVHGYNEDDRFTRARLGEFSFLGDNAVANSLAFWQIYGQDLDAAAEHEGTHLLGLFLHGPGLLHNNRRRIDTPDDFAGLKIRVPGGYAGRLMDALGASALYVSSAEVYAQLSRRVIDGVAFTLEALGSFNLTDYTRYSMTVPGGLYNTSWFLAVNQKAWESLSEADRQAIDAISGAAFAELAGRAWDAADARAAETISQTDIEIYPASPEVLTALHAAARTLEEAWADSLGDGYDGRAALAAFRAATGVELE